MEEVLYRKYRPMTFDEVRGQDHIVRALKNQIIGKRLNHAYIFTGIRGTGKTTVARILARAINCEHPVDGNPCNECATCRAILNDESLNVLEWDASANGTKEDIKDIERIISARPMQGHYRVFIMDETQFMKEHAVNAFLKTLEEPPEWIIFILSTTDLKNMPQTIVSRCQKYDFKRMDQNIIVDQLKYVLKKEERSIDERGLNHIAYASEGSMRDALSLLNIVLSFNQGNTISYDQTLLALDNTNKNSCDQLVRNLYDGNVSGAMKTMEDILMTGVTEEQLTADILQYLRDLFILKSNEETLVIATDEQKEMMKLTASEMDTDKIVDMMAPFHDVLKEIRYLTSQRTALEIAIVKAASFDEKKTYQEIEKRLKKLEDELQT